MGGQLPINIPGAGRVGSQRLAQRHFSSVDACQHPRSISRDDHIEKSCHHSSSHGNGRSWKGVDKMEAEDEG